MTTDDHLAAAILACGPRHYAYARVWLEEVTTGEESHGFYVSKAHKPTKKKPCPWQPSYQDVLGELIYERHPSAGMEHNGVWIAFPRFLVRFERLTPEDGEVKRQASTHTYAPNEDDHP